MAWQVRLNGIHPNGDSSFVAICDFYDDAIMDDTGKQPLIQFSYSPSFDNDTSPSQLVAALTAFGENVKNQRAKINEMISQFPVGKTWPL